VSNINSRIRLSDKTSRLYFTWPTDGIVSQNFFYPAIPTFESMPVSYHFLQTAVA
jgi:hypothetical protein